MKKLKFLPSLLMLVLSIAVLVLGVYAATPSTNTVTGSIKVNASAYPVSIDCLINGEEVESHSTLRAGITWTKGLSELTFDTNTALFVEEVEPIKLTFRITNLSNVELGAYFYTGTGLDEDNLATASSVMVEHAIKDDSEQTTIVNAYLSSYSYIAPSNNEFSTVDMNVVLMLNDFIYETKELSFSYTLNIEEYIPNTTVLNECAGGSDSNRLAPSNPFVKIASNVKDSNGNALTGIPAYAINSEYVEICVIPSTITAIEWAAFSRDASGAILRGVRLPESITRIEGYAFYETAAFNYLELPKALTSFGECAISVNWIEFVSTISIVGTAWEQCRVVKFNGDADIGDYAFEYGGLTHISFLGNSASIGTGAFKDTSLKQIVIGTNMQTLTSEIDENFNVERIIVEKGNSDVTFDASLPEVDGKSWYLNGESVNAGTKLQKSSITDNIYTCK